VGVAALLCAVLAPAHGFVATGGLARAMAPGPFDGNQTVTIELNASEAPSGDADVLRTRLQHLKIDATLSGAGADWTLELRDVVGAEEVLSAVLPRRALSIHEVLEDETRMARPSSVPTELANTLTVQECFDQTAERRFCTPMVVRPAVITKDDIANAWMTHNEWDGNVVAMVVFTDQGAQTMGDFSEALVGRRFAIVMDGEVLSAPRVNEPIRGGRAQITLGHQDNAEMEVQALVAALTTASLEGTWTARTSTPGR